MQYQTKDRYYDPQALLAEDTVRMARVLRAVLVFWRARVQLLLLLLL
jgi:hypothetical protein